MFRLICAAAAVCLFAMEATAQSTRPSSQELSAKTHRAQDLLDRYYGNTANIRQASKLIEEVLDANPRFVPAHVQAARATIMGGHIVSRHFTDGTLETAEKILLRARGLEPDNAEVHGLLGHVYCEKGQIDAAIQSLDRAKQLKSSNPWLDNNYGDVYYRIKKHDLADHRYQLVAARGPGSTAQQRRAYVHALEQRQRLAAIRRDSAEVLRLGKMATEAAPVEDAWVWGEVAGVFFYLGHFDEAIAHSRKALSIMDYGIGRSNLALGLYGKWASLVASGRADEGEKYFKEALSLNPRLAQVVQRFRRSAKTVADLAPVLERRQAEMGRR